MILNKIETDEEIRFNHKYNPNGIYPGAFVDVCIGQTYAATVRGEIVLLNLALCELVTTGFKRKGESNV